MSQVPMIGASEAIAKVLGACLLLFPYNRILTAVVFFITFVRIPAVYLSAFWFLLQFISCFGSFGPLAQAGGTAYWAYIRVCPWLLLWSSSISLPLGRDFGQKALGCHAIGRESGEPQYGTVVGETPKLFAVRTETGDVIMVEKRYAYPYDPATLEKLKHMYGKFLEAKMSLQAAWSNLVPLAGSQTRLTLGI